MQRVNVLFIHILLPYITYLFFIEGAFGVVKLGELHSSHESQQVAVKILKQRRRQPVTQSDRIKFYQEAAIMSQFENKNVVAFYGVIVNSARPAMVLEYMERGNLWKYLNRIRRIRYFNENGENG